MLCRIRDGAATRIRIIKRRELGVLAASLAGGEQEKVFSGGEQEKKLPLVNRTLKALSHWLSPAYGAVLELKPDLDQIEALSSERDALWTRLEAASFLTDDEKRAAIGYAAKGESGASGPSQDAAQKFNDNHDELGRFTFADGAGGSGGTQALAGGNSDKPGDGRTQVAQAESSGGYGVDLLEEESRGGHTKEYHVGKSPEQLVAHVRQKSAEFAALDIKATRIRAGSYPSIEAATKLTNSTLAQNREKVDRVARGELAKDFVTAQFGSITGTEAYARNVREEPVIRPAYGVGVTIVHDPGSKKGFTVITSYPRNDD